MRLYLIKTPRIIKKLFSRYTWSFFSEQKEVFLTFDDGPIPEVTEFVLSELKKHQALATFFCIGDNIRKYPLIFNEIIANGHSIGNHTYHHLNGWKTDNSNYFKNILQTETLIQNSLRKPYKKLFRPPYGKLKRKQSSLLIKEDYQIIMWDVLSADFDPTISKEKCLSNVLKHTNPGSIIVFHDSLKAKEKLYFSLPLVLEKLSKEGYKFNAIH